MELGELQLGGRRWSSSGVIEVDVDGGTCGGTGGGTCGGSDGSSDK